MKFQQHVHLMQRPFLLVLDVIRAENPAVTRQSFFWMSEGVLQGLGSIFGGVSGIHPGHQPGQLLRSRFGLTLDAKIGAQLRSFGCARD